MFENKYSLYLLYIIKKYNTHTHNDTYVYEYTIFKNFSNLF